MHLRHSALRELRFFAQQVTMLLIAANSLRTMRRRKRGLAPKDAWAVQSILHAKPVSVVRVAWSEWGLRMLFCVSAAVWIGLTLTQPI